MLSAGVFADRALHCFFSIMLIRVLFILVIYASASFAQTPRTDAEICSGRLEKTVFSEKVLSAKGLDPSKISFKLTSFNKAQDRVYGMGFGLDVYYAGAADVFAKLEVFQRTGEDGRVYAKTKFSQIYGRPEWGIDDSLRGKGIGSMLYLLGARLAKEFWRVPLISSLQCSDMATRLWMSFVEQGLAEVKSPAEIGTLAQTIYAEPSKLTYKVIKLEKVDSATDPIFEFFIKKLNPGKTIEQTRLELQ
jgi:hypothetical protein